MRLAELIGTRIRQVREKDNLGQKELGEALGKTILGRTWPKQVISAIELGQRELSITELMAFAEVLRMPVVFLLTPQSFDAEVELPARTVKGNELLEDWLLMPYAVDEEGEIDIIQSDLLRLVGEAQGQMTKAKKALSGIEKMFIGDVQPRPNETVSRKSGATKTRRASSKRTRSKR